MSKPKIYNPLSLDIEKDEPSFINEEGVKWWLVSVGSSLDAARSPQDGAVYRTLLSTGVSPYVVVHEGEVIKETPVLEHALAKVDQMYLRRTKL